MWATRDDDGRPTGFFEEGVHSSIPESAIEISREAWQECVIHSGTRAINDDGTLRECDPPQGTPIDAEAIRAYTDARLRDDPLVAELVEMVLEATSITMDELRARVLQRVGVSDDA